MNSVGTIAVAETASGKSHRDENFPVASFLIAPERRPPILAFYNFVRAADDIADHPDLSPGDKLALLDRLESALLQTGPDEPVARALREVLDIQGLSPRHALDLLTAFRQDVGTLRYENWNDLIDYCRYSAMPVGRFVLDAHGESPATTWGANDALCAALQIINHLQDCGRDYREIDRVYLPLDCLEAHGARVEMLGEERAPPPLRAAIAELAGKTRLLLAQSSEFADEIQDIRLAMEVGAIQRLAETLTARLRVADPLCEKVHVNKTQFALIGAGGAAATLLRRWFRPAKSGLDQ